MERLDFFVEALTSQWPGANVRNPAGADLNTYISVNETTDDALVWFQSWYRNAKSKEYIGNTQKVLDSLDTRGQNLVPYYFLQPDDHYHPKQCYIDLNEITGRPAPRFSPARLESFESWTDQEGKYGQNHSKLKSLLARLFSESSGRFEERYAAD